MIILSLSTLPQFVELLWMALIIERSDEIEPSTVCSATFDCTIPLGGTGTPVNGQSLCSCGLHPNPNHQPLKQVAYPVDYPAQPPGSLRR